MFLPSELRLRLKSIRDREMYRPTWRGVFFNKFFFVKRGIYRAIQRHAHLMTGSIADFGCGEKPYRDLFPCALYIGLDVCESGHPEHQKKPDALFDGLHIPLPNNCVDGVLATEVFEHVFRLEDALSEIHRILKPGGVLFATCPFCWPEHEEPYDFARYTRFALRDILIRNGFRVEIQEKEGHFLEAIFQIALCYTIRHLAPNQGLLRHILEVAYGTTLNLAGLTAGLILPKRWDLYLCNVVVATKASTPSRVGPTSTD